VALQAEAGAHGASSPTLAHELFASLLETLLTHDAAAAVDRAARCQHLSTQGVAHGAGELRPVIEAAALLEARLVAAEWSQVAQVALQATQVRRCRDARGREARAAAQGRTLTLRAGLPRVGRQADAGLLRRHGDDGQVVRGHATHAARAARAAGVA